MRQEVSTGSSSRGKNGFGDDGPGCLARVEGEEGVEFDYFIIVLASLRCAPHHFCAVPLTIFWPFRWSSFLAVAISEVTRIGGKF